MADKTKNGIQLQADAYVSERQAVLVPQGDGHITLYARALGFLEMSALINEAKASGRSWMVPFVAACIEDEDGNKFTLEEAGRLRQEIVDPLFSAAIEVNKLDGDEGKD